MSRERPRTSLYRRLFPWLLLAAALLLAYLTRAILLPFLVGFAVAYLLDPLADRLETKGLPRGLAAGLIIGFFFVVAATFVAALFPLLQTQLVDLVHGLPGLLATLRAKAESLLSVVTAEFGAEFGQSARQEAQGVLTAAVEKGFAAAGGMIGGLFAGGVALFNLLALILVSPVVAFYLLRDYDRITMQIEGLLPPEEAPAIKAMLRDVDTVLSGFVRGQLAVVLVMAVIYALGWTAIGLDYGLLLGLLAGVLTIIPFVGMIFAAAVAVAVGFVQWGADWAQLGLVMAVWGVAQALEGAVLTPRLVGRHVRLHPLWVLFAVFAGGEIAGSVGVLVAIPATAVIAVLVRTTLARYRAGGEGEGTALAATAAPVAAPQEEP